MVSPSDELERLQARSTANMAALLARAEIARLKGDTEEAERLTRQLARAMTEALGAADLLGRRRLLLEMKAAGFGAQFQATPDVPFLEAIESLVSRIPGLATTAEEVRALWADRGFALARSASLQVTGRVQQTIVRFLRQGQALTATDAVDQIQKSLATQTVGGPGGFTRAYADTVFRTTTSTAYQEGRQAQARMPGVRRQASGWLFDPILDADVRPNHRAGDGFIAHVDDPIWDTHAPPIGFNCRCSTTLVSTDRMVELGLSDRDGNPTTFRSLASVVSRGFRPDFGFR